MVKVDKIIFTVLGLIIGLSILTFFLGSINETTTTGSAVQNATNTTLSVTGGLMSVSGGAGWFIGVLMIIGVISWFAKNLIKKKGF